MEFPKGKLRDPSSILGAPTKQVTKDSYRDERIRFASSDSKLTAKFSAVVRRSELRRSVILLPVLALNARLI